MAGNKITKYDLVEAIYQNTMCEKRLVQDVVENLLLELKEAMKKGDTIELRGFGTFELRLRKGREKAVIRRPASSFPLRLTMLPPSVPGRT